MSVIRSTPRAPDIASGVMVEYMVKYCTLSCCCLYFESADICTEVLKNSHSAMIEEHPILIFRVSMGVTARTLAVYTRQ